MNDMEHESSKQDESGKGRSSPTPQTSTEQQVRDGATGSNADGQTKKMYARDLKIQSNEENDVDDPTTHTGYDQINVLETIHEEEEHLV